MDTIKLYWMCGISSAPAKPAENWVKAEMRFIGADRYVLGSKRVAVSFAKQKKGISLVIKGPPSVPAAMLLGPKISAGKLYDVELVTAELTLSLASLRPGSYPKVLRMNEVVEITA